jgi:hypothetical protein
MTTTRSLMDVGAPTRFSYTYGVAPFAAVRLAFSK